MIDPALDVWVWVACAVLLATMAARAWVVETGQGRLGRTPVQVKVLTGAVVLVVVGLFALMAMQGGSLLVDSLITGTNPADTYYGTGQDAGPADPAAPAAPPAGGAPAPAAPAPGG